MPNLRVILGGNVAKVALERADNKSHATKALALAMLRQRGVLEGLRVSNGLGCGEFCT
jgi:hypothetical protein